LRVSVKFSKRGPAVSKRVVYLSSEGTVEQLVVLSLFNGVDGFPLGFQRACQVCCIMI
jgi:hypothetical protein